MREILAGDDDTSDVAVQELKGRWTLKGTYVSTGGPYYQVGINLTDTPLGGTPGYVFQLPPGGAKVWAFMDYLLLTKDGSIELIDNNNDLPKIQLYRERKDFWSGRINVKKYDSRSRTYSDVELRVILYRNQ